MRNFLITFTVSLVLSFFQSFPLQSFSTSPVNLQLISGGQKGTHLRAGVLLSIPKGWHVYAPTPSGEKAAGFEPSLSHETSLNLKEAHILWPSAHKVTVQDQPAYVYEGQTLIPLDLIPLKSNAPLVLNIKVSFLACEKICVPVQRTLSLVINPGDTPHPLFKETQDKDYSFLALLGMALLGGFILNFMPCVLPVLSLKIMSLIKHSKKTEKNHVKQGFLTTGLGIITSFLLLAAFTLILKESGEAFGWGIHFQNPHFLLFVFLVLVAFTASLWGVFEVDLPAGLGTWLVTHEGKGRVKDFLGGVFATLLATPCSAPFLGTALSFALTRSPQDIFLVFFCLGLGFAMPYFLVAALPPHLIRLPAPGVWMLKVQKILGGFLAATALWIGWILSFHLPLWAIGTSLILVLLGLSLFWIKHHKRPTLKVWLLATPFFIAAWAMSWNAPFDTSPEEKRRGDMWGSFEESEISSRIKEGKVVFIDATAEWCVTCAVNKRLVLESPAIAALLKDPNVVIMRADWTKQDAAITSFLQRYGRYGIPFNIVFGPQAPEGIVLPEILTINAVQNAFRKAGL